MTIVRTSCVYGVQTELDVFLDVRGQVQRTFATVHNS